MSPNNRVKLNKLRNKLDKIDNDLLKIIKIRSNFVKEVLKLKNSKSEIVDNKRINFILKKIKKKSLQNNIDPQVTQRIWKSMIWSYIAFEQRNFKKK